MTMSPDLSPELARLFQEAEKHGLTLVDGRGRIPATVRLRLDGTAEDVERAYRLLAGRVHLIDPTTPEAKRGGSGGVLQYATLPLHHPDNQPAESDTIR